MKTTRKRPTYTFTLDPSPMDRIEEFARFNGFSMSHCMRQAVRNYARSVCQKKTGQPKVKRKAAPLPPRADVRPCNRALRIAV